MTSSGVVSPSTTFSRARRAIQMGTTTVTVNGSTATARTCLIHIVRNRRAHDTPAAQTAAMIAVMRSARLLLLVIVGFVSGREIAGQSPAGPLVPPDAEIRQLLVDRIDTLHESVGIVVGVI